MDQTKAPIYEALEKLKKMRLVPFDVPGHKRGHGNKELLEFLGEQCLSVDVNSMKLLDNLTHPVSVIKEAEELAAEAFGAKSAFFMVGGTTASVQSMIFATCKRNDKIIVPRNVHKSVMNALILCGAIPVYINPKINTELGIALGMSIDDVENTMKEHPDAKAIFVNNPTYYGVCSDLKKITELAHAHNMLCIVDEAHGTHFYFGEDLPISAMAAGADMAAVSMHKSGGSLTQSSFLLAGEAFEKEHVRQIINLTQTTSGSYLLLSSLDLSRRNLALHGKEIMKKVKERTEYARNEINQIGGYYAYSKELINQDTIYDFDDTKLIINTNKIGLPGIEVYDLLRDEYDIQIEFGDAGNVLAYISVGDTQKNIERLIGALAEIKRRYAKEVDLLVQPDYVSPIVAVSPQEAFYAQKEAVTLANSIGRISGEIVMSYPPGIPILSPGEFITEEIIDYIQYAKETGCFVSGTEDKKVDLIRVLKEEK